MTRALTAFFLSMLLAVTSVTMAVARGQAAGVADMVICAGGQTMTVTVDAQGNPVHSAHHCPDCLVALGGPAAALPVPGFESLTGDLSLPAIATQAVVAWPVLAASPRGPPVLS